jgi:serine/threonine protein kinase
MMREVSSNLPRERVGPYRLVRLLGKGGMGAVYEAIQEPIERRVAIKILHGRYAQEQEIATRFFNEARAVNIVDHPGIVQISDYGRLPSGVAYLVMEYLKGETLTQRMKRGGGKLPQPEALRLGRQIAAALAAAHEKGIIHRDLKPDNVMLIVDPDPEAMGRVRAKLLDFGIAKVAAEVGQDGAANTAADVVMGTPKYMSPEQCRGAANVDDKSDVYALGIMVYEMLAGRVPFLGPTGEILAKQIYEDPPQLGELAPWVTRDAAAFVHRLLHKEKNERPTMRQVTTELERMTAMFPTMAHQVVLPPQLLVSAPNVQKDDGPTVNEEEDITNPSMALPKGAIPNERDSNSGVRASTLGFSVGQSSLSMRTPPARWRRWLVPAGAALVVAAAIFMAVTLRQHTTVTPTRPATTKPVPKKVFWSVTSVPAGAEIFRISDETMLGKTPWHGEQEQGDQEVPVRLSLPGYQDRIVQLKTQRDDHKEVTLDPLPVETPKPVRTLWKRPQPFRPLPTKTMTPPNARPKIVD